MICILCACQNQDIESWNLNCQEITNNNQTAIPPHHTEINTEPNQDWQTVWSMCKIQDETWQTQSKNLAKSYRPHLHDKTETSRGTWYFLAGRLLGLWNKPDKSRKFFQQGIELDLYNPWPYYGMGMYFLKNNSYFYAQIYLEHTLKLQSQHVPAMIGLAKLFEEQDTNQAIQYLQQALNILPQDAELHHTLGLLLYQTGQADQSIEHLQLANTYAPKNPTILRDLAKIYLYQKRYEEAGIILQKLLPLVTSEQTRLQIKQLLEQLGTPVEEE